MNKATKFGVLMLACGSLAGMASAMSPDAQLQEYVVTATRTPVNTFDSKADISVITAKDIETHHFKDLTAALRTVPGVTITRYGNGVGYEQSDGVFINGSSHYVVLIDGSRVNTNGSLMSVFQTGAVRDLSNIAKIEVLKGSASVMYGSDAQGGVINIITKKAKPGSHTLVSLARGSYGKEVYNITQSGGTDKVQYRVDVQKNKSGDFKDAKGNVTPSYLNATTIHGMVHGVLSDRADVTLNYDKYNADYMYSGTNFKTSERHPGTAYTYRIELSQQYRWNHGTKNVIHVFNNRNDTYYDGWLMHLQTWGISDQFTRRINKEHNLVLGYDMYQDKILDYTDQMGTTLKGTQLTNHGLYVADTWTPSEKVNITVGTRYTHHSLAGNNLSSNLAVGYALDHNTNWYASVQQYFIAPGQYHYFSPYGNLKLKPEKGITYETGVKHRWNSGLELDGRVFYRNSNDVIQWQSKPAAPGQNPHTTGGEFVNRDKGFTHGWSLDLTKQWSNAWSTAIGYTHLSSILRVKGVDSTDKYLPNGEWHVGINYEQGRWNNALFGHGIIGRIGEGNKKGNPAFPANTYWVWDLALNYQAADNASVFFKVNNMFNQYYAERSNVKWGQPGEWYASPGRNYEIGVTIKL